jgi:DNA-binding response OmpR family regulator
LRDGGATADHPGVPLAALPARAAAGRQALVVDDAPDTRMLLTALLLGEGFAVEGAGDGDSAIATARRTAPELVLLDVEMPGRDGIEVCRELREFSDAYVIMLTAQDSEVDKVRGLASGADDYVTKPFSSAELLARVQAMLRRPRRGDAPVASAQTRSFAELTIDPLAREVRLADRPIELTRIEFDLLDALSAAPRVAFSREQLLDRVWGPNWFGDTHLVDVHVSNLRRKLGDSPRRPRFVATVRGVGYRMGSGQ